MNTLVLVVLCFVVGPYGLPTVHSFWSQDSEAKLVGGIEAGSIVGKEMKAVVEESHQGRPIDKLCGSSSVHRGFSFP